MKNILVCIALILTIGPAFGQANVVVNYQSSTLLNGSPTNVPVSNANPLPVAVSGGGSGGAVYGPTAVGSAAANPPILGGGTANAAATGTVQVIKVDAAGNQYVIDATGANFASVVAAIQAAALTPPIAVTGSATTDGSTTVTTGGTAQNLFSSTVPTNGFEVCNPNLTDDLWVSDSTTAAANGTGSHRLIANGGCYSTPLGSKPIQAVSLFGATTGDKITARRY